MQAALALSPRDQVNAVYGATSTNPEAVQYREWAQETLTVAVFEILIASTIGTLLIRLFAPKLLARVSICAQVRSDGRCTVNVPAI